MYTAAMQSPVLSFVVLQAVASTLAANLMTPSDTDTYSCTVLSNVYSDWCCVQVQSYPADANLSPGATVYNHIHEAIPSNNVSYGTETTFYSNLYYTVELTANYRNETMARDNSSFWYAGARYGAYDKADADLAVLNVSATSTTGAALTAAYWFECGSAREDAKSATTTTTTTTTRTTTTRGASCSGAAASARARTRSF